MTITFDVLGIFAK